MQGRQGPGRSVYTVRRILAVLIVLLLLALLVPQAGQAIRGTGSESGSGAPSTEDVESSGGDEVDAATAEETIGGTESAEQESTEQGSATESGSEDEQASSEDDVGQASGEDEDEDAQNVEFEASLAQIDVELDAAIDGGVNEIAPVPVVDLSLQQQVQPIALGEPVVLAQPIIVEGPLPPEPPVIPVQPIIEAPILLEEPAFFGMPFPFEGPIFFEEEPTFIDEPTYFEEPAVYDAGAPAFTAPTIETEVAQENAGETQGESSEASTLAIASDDGGRD